VPATLIDEDWSSGSKGGRRSNGASGGERADLLAETTRLVLEKTAAHGYTTFARLPCPRTLDVYVPQS
jgi:hypothetical protein